MSDVTLSGTYVLMCDWRGRCVWSSAELPRLKVGQFLWEHLAPASQKEIKLTLGRVVALREKEQVEVIDREHRRIRGWLWPLDSPNVAVCVLGTLLPRNLHKLTRRKRGIMELLAQGIETKSIAKRLDVSLSTVHTHMKRVREKLGLRSVEALISFAARFCYPLDKSFELQ